MLEQGVEKLIITLRDDDSNSETEEEDESEDGMPATEERKETLRSLW